MVFLVPALVVRPLPVAFSHPAAYGDLFAGILAIVVLFALRGGWTIAIPLIWVFNVIGFVDLLNAFYQGLRVQVQEDLGVAWLIPTFLVPPLLISHLMIFARLLRRAR